MPSPSPRLRSMLPLVLRSCPHFTLDQPYSLFFNSVIPAYSNVPSVVNVIAADCLADCPLTYRQDMFGSWIVIVGLPAQADYAHRFLQHQIDSQPPPFLVIILLPVYATVAQLRNGYGCGMPSLITISDITCRWTPAAAGINSLRTSPSGELRLKSHPWHI